MNAFSHDKRGAMTAKRIAIVWARCDGHCVGCKRKLYPGDDFEIDHVIALSKGGTDQDDNLQLLCSGCHIIKTGGDVSDAAKSKRIYIKHVVPKGKGKKGWRS